MRAIALLLLLSPFATASAVEPPVDTAPVVPVLEPPTDDILENDYGGRVEVRLDADLTGDGLVDVAAVMREEDADRRRLVVMRGFRGEFDQDHEPLAEMAMDPFPVGAATLIEKKGVLVVEDLSGGTRAIASTYRFRYDAAAERMRLIGDDVVYYSRTFGHDSVRISTNRLTGLRISRVDKVDAEGEITPQPETRETVDKAPVWMETAPPPDVTLGLGLE